MLARTSDSALPSLYEACHEEAYAAAAATASPAGPRPGGPGSASSPAAATLPRRAPRQEPAGQPGDRGAARPDLPRPRPTGCAPRTRLAAAARPPRRGRPVPRRRPARRAWPRAPGTQGAQVIRSSAAALSSPGRSPCPPAARRHAAGGHTHSTELARWDQAYPAGASCRAASAASPSDPSGALGDLVVAAVRAAVIAPESEVRRWFSWPWYWTGTLVDDLVRTARLRRVGTDLTAG